MHTWHLRYNDVIMTTIASQITSLAVVYSTVYSDADQRKHQSSVSLVFVWGINRDRWIPRTNAENVSIWWRHHVVEKQFMSRSNSLYGNIHELLISLISLAFAPWQSGKILPGISVQYKTYVPNITNWTHFGLSRVGNCTFIHYVLIWKQFIIFETIFLYFLKRLL